MDKQHLVTEGSYLVCFIPPTGKALVFRVKAVANRAYPDFAYGALPLSSGDSLSSYDGGSVSVPADGVIPARGYTREGKAFPLSGVYDESDMWFVPKDYNTRLFHVFQEVTPAFLRTDIQIPKDVNQTRFQRGERMVGLQANFGFARGMLEVIHFPAIRYGYRWGNDSNLDLYTQVKFTYGEYVIEIPKDAELIFNVMTKKVPSYWYSLPITSYDESIKKGLSDAYGFEGFTLYPATEKEKAVSEYEDLLKEAKV